MKDSLLIGIIIASIHLSTIIIKMIFYAIAGPKTFRRYFALKNRCRLQLTVFRQRLIKNIFNEDYRPILSVPLSPLVLLRLNNEASSLPKR